MVKHSLESNQRHYVFADDVLISKQFMLMKSLIDFSMKMVNNKDIMDDPKRMKEEKLYIPEDKNSWFESIIIKYLKGDIECFESILKSCQDLLNRCAEDIGLEKPKEVIPKILLREKETFISLYDLKLIHPEFPVQFKSITSKFGSGLLTIENQFRKTHKIVFKNKLCEMLYVAEFFKSKEDYENFTIPTLYKNDLDRQIQEDLDDGRKVYITTTDVETINKYKDEDLYMVITVPSNCGFIDLNDIPVKKRSKADIW